MTQFLFLHVSAPRSSEFTTESHCVSAVPRRAKNERHCDVGVLRLYSVLLGKLYVASRPIARPPIIVSTTYVASDAVFVTSEDSSTPHNPNHRRRRLISLKT